MVLCAIAVPAFAAQAPAPDPVHVSPVIQSAAPGSLLEGLMFYAVAGVVVVSALGVCCSKNVVRMAVWLFVTLGSVAMLFFLLSATFLGAIQLMVYVGGTLILLVFGVMLTSKSPWARFETSRAELAAAAGVCLSLCAVLCLVFVRAAWPEVEGAVPGTPVAELGRRLMTTYLVPFEVAGVLLMIVMVGAAHLARGEAE